MSEARLSIEAPAKINLGLHVLHKRPDGFHGIETVMVAIGWRDRLVVAPRTTFSFTCSDHTLPTDESNLCVRAGLILAEKAGIAASGHLHLAKVLPHGAGLGGGSSNAAAALRLLYKAWGLDLPQGVLHELACELGSDVPFFLHDSPMLATGRGEELTPLAYEIPFSLAVVMPDVRVSTPHAYSLVTPHAHGRADIKDVVLSNSLSRWRAELVNDFQAVVADAHPAVERELALLEAHGAGYASLSGSGAAVFGVFTSDRGAQAAASDARRRGLAAWAGRAEARN